MTKWLDTTGTLGDSLIHDTGSALGVGTTTPGASLDFQLNNSAMILGGTGTHSFSLQGALSNGRFGQDSEGVFFASDTSGKVFKFLTNNGTLNENMRIASNGFVGIGTTLPGSTLDISQDNASLILRGTGTHSFSLQGALSNGRFGQDSEGVFFASDTNGKAFKFLTHNGALNEWMRITSGGNVGIGTNAPSTKLEVAGDVSVAASGTFIGPPGMLLTHANFGTALGYDTGSATMLPGDGGMQASTGATSGSIDYTVGGVIDVTDLVKTANIARGLDRTGAFLSARVRWRSSPGSGNHTAYILAGGTATSGVLCSTSCGTTDNGLKNGFGFKIVNSTVYGYSASGGTGAATNAIGSVSASQNDWVDLFAARRGSSIYFYAKDSNGTSGSQTQTNSSYLPSTAGSTYVVRTDNASSTTDVILQVAYLTTGMPY